MPVPREDMLVDINDGLAVVTFNRPEVMNAFRRQTCEELLSVLDELAKNDGVKGIVLTGAGRAFCAGEDLRELNDLLAEPESLVIESERQLATLQELTRRFVKLTKPTIAAINGVAVGLGAELAIACDLRVASETATIGFVEAKRGLFQTNGSMYFLPRLVGLGHALELLLTGDRVGAEEALRMGLVNRVESPDRLMDETLLLARTIVDNSPVSIRLVKDIMGRTYELDLEAVMDLEVEGMRACLRSEDMLEGITAFLERRSPQHNGA